MDLSSVGDIRFLLYSLLQLFVVYKVLKWLLNYIYKLSVINKMKGLPIIPFVGNVHQFKRKYDFLLQLQEVSKENVKEPFFRLWLGSKNQEKSFNYKFLHPWLGTGLLTSYGTKWYNRRHLITPTFHFEILKDFLHVMNEQSEILTHKLETLSKNEQEVDIFKQIALCALDIICESAMGQNVNAQQNKDSEYVIAVSRISDLILERMITPWNWIDLFYRRTKNGVDHYKYLEILQGFTKKVILQRNEEFTNYTVTNKRIAFLDMLLKAKSEDSTITFDDIQEEVDTFMFEGHDTTAVAASWACHMIGWHPEVQKKLHNEIDRIFNGSDRHVTNEDLGELKYLECVIKETLRLFPSVPFYGRILSEDCEAGGYKLLKGSNAVILAYMIHRDEKYYPNPEKFDPDRFLTENSFNRYPYAYIPFSAGKRNCVGQRFALMEEKVILTHILRKFEIKSLKTTEEIKPLPELILRPSSGIPIQLKIRKFE